MPATITEFGYLTQGYLNEFPYMSGQIHFGGGAQVDMVINNEVPVGLQSEMIVNTEIPAGLQAEMVIAAQEALGMQADLLTDILDEQGVQVLMRVSIEPDVGLQVLMKFVDQTAPQGLQALMKREDKLNQTGVQIDGKILDQTKTLGFQAKIFPLQHLAHGKYLTETEPYMSGSYLSPLFCAFQSMQSEMIITKLDGIGTQAEMLVVDSLPELGVQARMQIDDSDPIGMQSRMVIAIEPDVGIQSEMIVAIEPDVGMQVRMRIDTTDAFGVQAEMKTILRLGTEITGVIYNTTQLRILCDFPSRGLTTQSGATWTSVQAIRTGDFSPNNLNTDIIEQRTETAAAVPLWELQCDTGQINTTWDTLAVLDHNFTGGATISFQGSNDAGFGSLIFSLAVPYTTENLYLLIDDADFPLPPARYYRLLIQDNANPDALRIGTVVFGSSLIFTRKEQFENPLEFGFEHFKDTMQNEGFNQNSNDRAIRRRLGLDFRHIDFHGQNFARMRTFELTAKTDLKCLVIPYPQEPATVSVFAKLIKMPQESHTNNDDQDGGFNHLVDFSLEWDESQ